MRTIVSLLALALLSLVFGGACSDGDAEGSGLEVVATTGILGDIVAQVAGPDAVVEVLIPSGADPHDYHPSSAQVALLGTSDLIVANGLGLEEGLQDVLDAVTSDGANLLAVGEMIDPIGDDPHFWLDPLRVAEAARLVAAELAIAEAGVDWTGRAEAYAAELEDLHDRITTTLAPIPITARKLVTNHEALAYFAERYGFEVVGVVIPGGSTMGEPSSEQLAALVRTIEEERVQAIFAETTEPTRLAQAVADEVGHDVEVVELHTESLGGGGSGAETLVGMLETDAELIAEALD